MPRGNYYSNVFLCPSSARINIYNSRHPRGYLFSLSFLRTKKKQNNKNNNKSLPPLYIESDENLDIKKENNNNNIRQVMRVYTPILCHSLFAGLNYLYMQNRLYVSA